MADRAWWGEGMATPAAFVGREDELSRLLAALANQTRMVLVVGDAGVGKTRLAGEAMARAAVTGMVTVRGECLPLGERLPLLPVAAALDDLARLDGGELLEAALAAAPEYVQGEVGRLLPRLGSGGRAGAGRLGAGMAAGAAVPRRSRSCWTRRPAVAGPGSRWWSRMCTGRTARRWIS